MCVCAYFCLARWDGGWYDAQLPIGRLVECLVASVNKDARTVTLLPGEAPAEAMTSSDAMSLRGIKPGMLVNTIVTKVCGVHVCACVQGSVCVCVCVCAPLEVT